MSKYFKRITAFFLSLLNLLLLNIGLAGIPCGDALDMSKFAAEPTFAEEFDGETLNDVWKGHYTYGDATSERRGGYWNRALCSVSDGALTITTKYLENGVNDGDKAGWYSYGLDTNHGGFAQKYGYFETRCILPSGEGMWSAFWMLTDSMMDETLGGTNGAEIDIFESPYYSTPLLKNAVCQNLHIDGYSEKHSMESLGKWRVEGDPYSEYHTYGVEWNESEYTFYIDGTKTASSSFGGVSEVPEYLILSVEVGGEKGVPGSTWAGDITNNDESKAFESRFVVDYVKAYQYK